MTRNAVNAHERDPYWLIRAMWHDLFGHPPEQLRRWEQTPKYGWCAGCRNVVIWR